MIRRRVSFLFAGSLSMIAIADWLFYSQPIGWSLSLFTFTAAAFVLLRGGAHARSKSTLAVMILLLGLVLALAIQPGPLVTLMTFIALALLATAMRHHAFFDAIEIVEHLIQFGARVPVCAMRDVRLLGRVSRARKESNDKSPLWRSIGKWILPIGGSLLFSALFAVANPVISTELRWMGDRFDSFLTHLQLRPERLIFWMITGAGAWALLRIRTRTLPFQPTGSYLPMPDSRTALLRRCLFMFNSVFAVQTLLDTIYLTGGLHLPNGLSYAEYAHRGAYPLVATALLAAAFVLIGYRPGPATRETATVRRLVLLWLLQNVFLTLTAAWRLHIYTEIYGLTRLRVAAAIWIFLVAAGLAWIGLRIARGKSNRWLVSQTLSTTFIVLYLCCFVNFDSWIAWQNVRHCREAGGTGYYLDYNYMLLLGPEAIPPLRWARSQKVDQSRHNTLEILQSRLNRQMQNWRAWTYRSWQLWDGGLS